MNEIIVDSFAGGGGTSEGIRQAIGRDPDIAINHDKLALAMHRMNHPGTHHMVEDVWSVDARTMCNGRPIGLLWLSPDCKHFSKAKGGKPRERAIRGLAWVGVNWVKSLPKRQRPRIIILENVEEFQDWGPLREDGTPCPVQKGETFKAYIAAYAALGYKADWRELRACDYGDPTIRKRLFVILRRDGKRIVWPVRTHGNPKDAKDAALIAVGKLRPWRTAAEIIDWSLPCPSIFDSAAEIKAKHGLRANRPLRPATMARVAKGTKRYVLDAIEPFIVPVMAGGVTPFVTYAQQGGSNRDALDPLHTITASAKDQNAIVTPFVTKFNTGSTGQDAREPLATVTSHAGETHGGGAAPLGIVAPYMVRTAHGDVDANGKRRGRGDHSAEEPMPTVLASNDSAIVSPFLVPRYMERPGQEPRTRPVDVPTATIVPGGNEGVLAAVHLNRQFGASIGADATEPAPTVTAGGAGKTAVVAAFLAQHNTDMVGKLPDEPVSTIVGKGCTQGVVSAFLAQHNTDRGDGIKAGTDVREPVRTVTASGGQQTVVAASFLSHAFTSNTNGGNGDPRRPLKTVLAGGQHAAAVYAFLSKYYGEGLPSQPVNDPLHTVTAKPRHGLVTVSIGGEPFVISDIGMRMLTPRERFSAQGFRSDYIIDRGELEDGSFVNLTLEQQGRMCGNSVCPGMSRALVGANYKPAALGRPMAPMRDAPLLVAAE